VLKYRKVKAKGKESFQIVLDVTPFYAESGGQVGDTGELIFQGESIQIVDTKKENDLIIHFAETIPADMSGGVLAKVDEPRRKATEKHHSATHLLHAALRNVLGTHVAQKGSLNNESSLRFDFSHFAKMTDEEVHQVEAIVNEKIRANVPVVIKSMHKDEAVALGAMALFGEKYGDIVRVVIMDPGYSIELCGGTHVGNTGELGFFKIVHETAVAAGVRRIEAVTGKAAEDYVNGLLHELHHAKAQLKHPKHLSKSIETLLEEQTALRKKLEGLEAKQLAVQINEITTEAKQNVVTKNGYTFYGKEIEAASVDNMRKIATELITHFDVVVLCAKIDGKASIAIALSDKANTEKGLDAGKLIKEKVAPLIKGGGGGQKTLATAGGQDVSKLAEVVGVIEGML
jgi:alanyl-tRNA synthetase